jgi:hypothetical protein
MKPFSTLSILFAALSLGAFGCSGGAADGEGVELEVIPAEHQMSGAQHFEIDLGRRVVYRFDPFHGRMAGVTVVIGGQSAELPAEVASKLAAGEIAIAGSAAYFEELDPTDDPEPEPWRPPRRHLVEECAGSVCWAAQDLAGMVEHE